jgi:hypothetical protein
MPRALSKHARRNEARAASSQSANGSCEHFRSHCDGVRSKLLAGPAKIFTRYFLMEKAVLQ